MKNLIIMAIVIFSITRMSAQAPPKSKADVDWETLNTARETTKEIDRLATLKEIEKKNREYLKSGLRFWKEYPTDKRRIEWFETVNNPFYTPNFWKNIDEGAKAAMSTGSYLAEIDWKQFNKWEKKRLELRAKLLNDPTVSRDSKRKILQSDLRREVYRGRNTHYRGNKELYKTRLKQAFDFGFITLNITEDCYAFSDIEQIYVQSQSFGLDMYDLANLANYFNRATHPFIKQWAEKKNTLFSHINIPFELKCQTVEGLEMDISKLKGKVILVDFWALGCTQCIMRMPAIKAIYDKYKNQGFLVISTALAPNIDREKVIKIHRNIGADWPLTILGGDSQKPGMNAANSLAAQISKTYGFTYVPQLLLLDKAGKLVEYNGPLINSDFEPLIKKLLSK